MTYMVWNTLIFARTIFFEPFFFFEPLLVIYHKKFTESLQKLLKNSKKLRNL